MGTDETFTRRMEALRLLMSVLDMLDADEDRFAHAYVATAIDKLEISMKGVTLRSPSHRQ
ncbi:hypothetical protein OLX02_15665 [Novosphingobium sp. KCTC 2891]|uniref:hypothetical protein n=1 Tax=Novosphingobium sp. KCTC 2891 TaxID=2989730 RepID=UPI0022237C7B|nr:hypothetical protein [Novosphingobium sp. KCTC 2891]MCW1384262.1 hypothetical protein [Novosphingobium sp. KCTC 2891]